MAHNLDYFRNAAYLSQTVLLASVVELARRKDFVALSVFIEFAASQMDTRGPFERNQGIGFQTQREVDVSEGSDIRTGMTTPVYRYSDALMMPLAAPMRHSDAVQINDVKHLSDIEVTHASKVMDLDKNLASHEIWRDAILAAMCRSVNDPRLASLLIEHGYALDGLTQSAFLESYETSGAKRDRVPYATEAVIFGNLELACALYQQTPAAVLEAFMTETHLKRSRAAEIVVLASALHTNPLPAFEVLQAMEDKVGVQNMLIFRLKLAKKYIQYSNPDESPLSSQTVLDIFGPNEAGKQAIQTAIDNGASEAVGLCNILVNYHCTGPLQLFKKMLDPCAPVIVDVPKQSVPKLSTCMGPNSIKLTDTASVDRFRETVEFFLDLGYTLANVGGKEPQSALHYIATQGSQEDRERKLIVLLCLGADPLQKNELGRIPRSNLPVNERESWSNIVHSFRAREKSMSLLDEMDAPSTAKPAKRTRKTT